MKEILAKRVNYCLAVTFVAAGLLALYLVCVPLPYLVANKTAVEILLVLAAATSLSMLATAFMLGTLHNYKRTLRACEDRIRQEYEGSAISAHQLTGSSWFLEKILDENKYYILLKVGDSRRMLIAICTPKHFNPTKVEYQLPCRIRWVKDSGLHLENKYVL